MARATQISEDFGHTQHKNNNFVFIFVNIIFLCKF